MTDRKRERFEAHLLACTDCWQEVTQARSGRAIGESLRELAPQSLREDIRAATQSESSSSRRFLLRWTAAAAVAVTLMVIAGTALLRPGPGDRPVVQQPESIAQAIIDFQNGRIPAERPVEQAAPDLAGPDSPWMASSQGIGLLCAQKPFPLLALSEDPDVLQELSTYLRVS